MMKLRLGYNHKMHLVMMRLRGNLDTQIMKHISSNLDKSVWNFIVVTSRDNFNKEVLRFAINL